MVAEILHLNMVAAGPSQLADSPPKCSEVQKIPALQLPSPWLIHPPVATPGGGGDIGPAHAYNAQLQIAHENIHVYSTCAAHL